jgi:murein DD-endopeptidase MepM/ murein hydrolase activator NlpD
MLAVPAALPAQDVLDLAGGPVRPAAVVGQEPAAPLAAPSWQPVVSAAPSATPPATGGTDVARSQSSRWPSFATRMDEPGLRPSPPALPTVPPVDTLTGYRWPMAHPRLTLPFGPTLWGSLLVDGERFHDGIDLATFCGDRITAAHDGVVLAAGRHFDRLLGWIGDLGPYFARLDKKHLWGELPIVVVIDDGNGYRSVYAHFSVLKVRVGQAVRAGDLLGLEGATGHATGCHLHYGLFSPAETATFALRSDIARRMHLPRLEIARVDPLLVLPPRRGISARPHPAVDLTPVS